MSDLKDYTIKCSIHNKPITEILCTAWNERKRPNSNDVAYLFSYNSLDLSGRCRRCIDDDIFDESDLHNIINWKDLIRACMPVNVLDL